MYIENLKKQHMNYLGIQYLSLLRCLSCSGDWYAVLNSRRFRYTISEEKT